MSDYDYMTPRRTDCGRFWSRPIYGRDIQLDHVLEPDKYTSWSPYRPSDYNASSLAPQWEHVPGWLVTGIERVQNKDGRPAVMLDLEWGLWNIHQPDHTNAMTWAWEDEAIHAVLCHEDGTPLSLCEAYNVVEAAS
jgi:hypothetical protein